MKQFETILGTVTATNATMIRKSGYGQYAISITLQFEGE